jgi:hypothetical protein
MSRFMILLVFCSGCGVDDRCSTLMEARYLECADAVVQIEIEQCSEECVEALSASTCDDFKARAEVCHDS